MPEGCQLEDERTAEKDLPVFMSASVGASWCSLLIACTCTQGQRSKLQQQAFDHLPDRYNAASNDCWIVSCRCTALYDMHGKEAR